MLILLILIPWLFIKNKKIKLFLSFILLTLPFYNSLNFIFFIPIFILILSLRFEEEDKNIFDILKYLPLILILLIVINNVNIHTEVNKTEFVSIINMFLLIIASIGFTTIQKRISGSKSDE
jgi:glucan phosphoethanolaminetransferase (alkaline phosphatase superfamily)